MYSHRVDQTGHNFYKLLVLAVACNRCLVCSLLLRPMWPFNIKRYRGDQSSHKDLCRKQVSRRSGERHNHRSSDASRSNFCAALIRVTFSYNRLYLIHLPDFFFLMVAVTLRRQGSSRLSETDKRKGSRKIKRHSSRESKRRGSEGEHRALRRREDENSSDRDTRYGENISDGEPKGARRKRSSGSGNEDSARSDSVATSHRSSLSCSSASKEEPPKSPQPAGPSLDSFFSTDKTTEDFDAFFK